MEVITNSLFPYFYNFISKCLFLTMFQKKIETEKVFPILHCSLHLHCGCVWQPPMWETRWEFLPSGLTLEQVQPNGPLGPFGNEPAGGKSLWNKFLEILLYALIFPSQPQINWSNWILYFSPVSYWEKQLLSKENSVILRISWTGFHVFWIIN